jgi:hypothetical protein
VAHAQEATERQIVVKGVTSVPAVSEAARKMGIARWILRSYPLGVLVVGASDTGNVRVLALIDFSDPRHVRFISAVPRVENTSIAPQDARTLAKALPAEVSELLESAREDLSLNTATARGAGTCRLASFACGISAAACVTELTGISCAAAAPACLAAVNTCLSVGDLPPAWLVHQLEDICAFGDPDEELCAAYCDSYPNLSFCPEQPEPEPGGLLDPWREGKITDLRDDFDDLTMKKLEWCWWELDAHTYHDEDLQMEHMGITLRFMCS